MYASIRRISAIAIVGLFFALVRCVSLQSTASGGTGSETVIGTLVNEDGTPAGKTEVTMRLSDFDPASGQKPSAYGADTTDNEGNFSITIASMKGRRYTLQAVNLPLRTRAFIPEIDFSGSRGSTVVATAVLHKTGSIKVVRSDSSINDNGYAFIPGTTFLARMANGHATIDSVPAETISHVFYSQDEMISPRTLAEAVGVKPGITTIVAYSGSAYSAKLTLNTTPGGADVAETVIGFPVLIRLSGDNFNFIEARTDGSDLRFTKPDNTPVPFEIERWDAAARQAEVWVKVDTVYGKDSSHFVVMYWGEPATVIALGNATVFDTTSGYRGVWHLAEEAAGVGTKRLYKDATGRNSGDDFISATGRSGIIGYGHAFDGIDDYIPVNSPVTAFVKGDLTIALWVNIHDSGGTILSKIDSTPSWYKGESSFYFGDGSETHAFPGANGARPSFVEYTNSSVIASQSVASGDWHHLAFTWKWQGDSTGTPRYFIDGVEVPLSRDSLVARIDENADATVKIGRPNNNESFAYFKGLMDELEISAVDRSADWIKLCYMNQRKENVLVKY